jgi:hypothetical protein
MCPLWFVLAFLRARRTPNDRCQLSDDLDEQGNDARVVVAGWRATGSPTATRNDPLDVGAVPPKLLSLLDDVRRRSRAGVQSSA